MYRALEQLYYTEDRLTKEAVYSAARPLLDNTPTERELKAIAECKAAISEMQVRADLLFRLKPVRPDWKHCRSFS